MTCPKCGSENIQVVNDTKGFGAGKGCLGVLLLGPIGFLCGLCGMGKSKGVKRVCANCGHQIK